MQPPSNSIAIQGIEVCGDDLLTLSLPSTRDASALAGVLRRELEGIDIVESVPGMDSVVVQFDAANYNAEAVELKIRGVVERGVPSATPKGPLIEIPVVYGGDDGPDLSAVCRQTGLSEDEVIELHSGRDYTVDLIGFTPGFAFIGGLDERLNVPRRSEPREHVPAGSIGIAGGRTGVYALPVPGGWSLIGRTALELFNATAEPPNRLDVGTRVRFVVRQESVVGE